MDKQSIQSTLEIIVKGLKNGDYKNESAVSQGIVSALLHSLGWNVFDISEVTREYSTGNGRVDYALCNKPEKPFVFLEVKAVGKAKSEGEEQLFRYAFDEGVPILILTDGKEWSFYLPAEQGKYNNRQFYKLDLLERSVDDCVEVFRKFLLRKAIVSEHALEEARKVFQGKKRDEEVSKTLPHAWESVWQEVRESLLVDLLAEKVADLCGHKPEKDVVEKFLEKKHFSYNENAFLEVNPAFLQEESDVQLPHATSQRVQTARSGPIELVYKGQTYNVRSAIDALRKTLVLFAENDSKFLSRFQSETNTKKRSRVSRNTNELYKNRPDLLRAHGHIDLSNGWYMGKNMNKKIIEDLIDKAQAVAGIGKREFKVRW